MIPLADPVALETGRVAFAVMALGAVSLIAASLVVARRLAGTLAPGQKPVQAARWSKANGGTRRLGIPTVLDRLIQQAIHQKLGPLWEPEFSAHSYGFRPHRSAHDAVRAAQAFIRAGKGWVVDIDLKAFFDHVNHDRLMHRLGRKVRDPQVPKLGSVDKTFDLRFLNALIAHHRNGVLMTREIRLKSSRSEIIDNANAVEQSLTKGIEMMRAWRTQWYGVTEPQPLQVP